MASSLGADSVGASRETFSSSSTSLDSLSSSVAHSSRTDSHGFIAGSTTAPSSSSAVAGGRRRRVVLGRRLWLWVLDVGLFHVLLLARLLLARRFFDDHDGLARVLPRRLARLLARHALSQVNVRARVRRLSSGYSFARYSKTNLTGAFGRVRKHPVIMSRNKSSTLLSRAYRSSSSIILARPRVRSGACRSGRAR